MLVREKMTLTDVRKMKPMDRALIVVKVLEDYATLETAECELWFAVIRQTVLDLASLIRFRQRHAAAPNIAKNCPTDLSPDPEFTIMQRDLEPMLALTGLEPEFFYGLLLKAKLIKRMPPERLVEVAA